MLLAGLFALWAGAMALLGLLLLREKGRVLAAALPLTWRRSLEAACIFTGSSGLILGLGFLLLAARR